MKFRNLLMTFAFLLAISSTFAFKAKPKTIGTFSYKIGATCYIMHGETDQENCGKSFPGAQCTYLGQPAYYYDVTTSLPPDCLIPLRQPW